jgi:hypothetical protein
MAVFRLTKSSIEPLDETSFVQHDIRERSDLQRLLKANVSVVAPEVLIIAEEFGDWQDSKRRIDLLGVDHDAKLVVIELKRDEVGGHMELQAIRYAAMVSTMTFDHAAQVYQQLLDKRGELADGRQKLLEFLNWEQPQDGVFAQEVRIVLVAADFSKELTTSALWLCNEYDLDIRCIRLKPYALESQVIIDVQQIVPLPEADVYQVRLREQAVARRESIRQSGVPTGYWFVNVGDDAQPDRSWEDRRRYGFMSAGGGQEWIDAIRRLKRGDQFFAYAVGAGYVGFGSVTTEAVPFAEFQLPGNGKRLLEMELKSRPNAESLSDPSRCDWCVGVEWFKTLDRKEGVLRHLAHRGTVCQIRRKNVVEDLLKTFGGGEPPLAS